MPFSPHTEDDIAEMMAAIGVQDIGDLFDEIPDHLRIDALTDVPSGLNEMAVARLMSSRAGQDGTPLCFIGAGAYEHHVPAAVWELTTRGEYYTAYTPYQAEASQGTLQLLYEFQSMMVNLMAMDVSNASLYDGASACAEAALMAVRCQRKVKSRRILVPKTVHPHYRQVINAVVKNQGLVLDELDYDVQGGFIDPDSLPADPDEFAALIIPQPNFFGVLEEVDRLTDWAHQHGGLVIAQVNPMAMSLLAPPGEWGEKGADIVCGEGQPLGIPLSSGGPYFGFLCCKKPYVRQMPGRIVGRTVDHSGKPGFTLTLQAREQHIRRSKATSNICTNQGLMVTAATIYMAMMGADGLNATARASHAQFSRLKTMLNAVEGVEIVFNRPMFHEMVVKVNGDVDEVISRLADQGIAAGYSLKRFYPELGDALLLCVTETKTDEDLKIYAQQLAVVQS